MQRARQSYEAGKKDHSIIALLFSLAVIAEIASCLPSPLRRTVLAILWRAERISHSYVYWSAHDCGLSLGWGIPDDCRGAADAEAAMVLAGWFQLLALLLRDLPRRAFAIKLARSGWAVECIRRITQVLPIADAPIAFDTS